MKDFEIDNKQIGQRICFARRDKRLTCDDLAQQTGLSPSMIRHIESGSRRCSIESLVRICSALNLSTDYVLLGKDPENEKIAIICDYLESQLDNLKGPHYTYRFLK